MSSINGLGGMNYGSLLISSTTPTSGKKLDDTAAGALTQSSATTPSSQANKSSATDEFKKYMEMSPAEKIRYGVMNEMGLTEEQLAAMPPEQRAQVEKKIADMVALRTGNKPEDTANAGVAQTAASMGLNLLKQVQAGSGILPFIDTFT